MNVRSAQDGLPRRARCAAGFVDGRSLLIDARCAAEMAEWLPGLPTEQLALRPDQILAVW